jgi:hypothetical protein
MTEERKMLTTSLLKLAAGLIGVFSLVAVSCDWIPPLTYTNIKTPQELLGFLESRRQDMQAIKVNRHMLEIGKRPSLQVLKGYNHVMYQMRPYRQINLKFRNFTKAELMDFCTNITTDALEKLRALIVSGKGFSPAWKGAIKGHKVEIVRATQFSYLVIGLADKPLFMGQVDLAKRLGMDDAAVLSSLIPLQDSWLDKFKSDVTMNKPYPVGFLGISRDNLIEWLGTPGQDQIVN